MACHNQLVAAAKVCDDVGDLFRLWVAVFKAIHEEDPTTPTKLCQNSDKIELIMTHWRKCIKMSIISKLHGIEAHLMRQLLNIKGDITRFIDHWVEQYHLVGCRYALSY